MKKHDIAILALQETKTKHTHREIRDDYTWFFSGEHGEDTQCHGVGFVIRNDYKKYIYLISPVNDRIMYVRLRLYKSMFLNCIVIYAANCKIRCELNSYNKHSGTYWYLRIYTI